MLEVRNLDVVYSGVILALTGVSLTVPERSVVALLGANGAGKTTTLKAISGLLAAEDGNIERGTVIWNGMPIERHDPVSRFRSGMVQVLEGRPVLGHLTVQQNLLLGAHLHRDRQAVRDGLEQVLTYFPKLRQLLKRTAGYLSGGEQQMLVFGRALMARPRLVMLDEPSLGLAPQVVHQIFEIIRKLNEEQGISFLLVEQNARLALEYAHHGYVLENGRVVLEGAAEQLKDNEDIREFYMGLSLGGSRRSYREAKHYKRRKRWLG